MRILTSLLLFTLIAAPTAHADAVRYEQIPADSTSYFHADMDRFLSSRAAQASGQVGALAAQFNSLCGGLPQSLTMYTVGNGEDARIVLIARGNFGAGLMDRLKAAAAKLKDAVTFNLDGKDVYYSSASVQAIVQAMASGIPVPPPSPQEAPSAVETQPIQSHLSMGLGGKTDDKKWSKEGPSYIAAVGNDEIIVTADLSAMAHALDVIAGKSPSLVSADPHGLKSDLPQGVMFSGMGVNADLKLDSTTQRAEDQKPDAFEFGMNLFGSLEGKMVLTRFDAGENDQTEFVDATCEMTDSDSADEMKNLVFGVKGLISLSPRVDNRILIKPLTVKSDGKTVSLHWSWPTAKVVELFDPKKLRADHDNKLPTQPDAQPNP